MTFAGRLREYREHRGLSLQQLGRKVGYSASHLSNVENGTKPATEEMARLCDEALRAKGELLHAQRAEFITRLDDRPWETAELLGRLQMSDVSPVVLESLQSAVVELCCQYAYRDAFELRAESLSWLDRVATLLKKPVGLKAHDELLASAGWLALLTGCLEYDLGMRAAAESTRTAALQMATESNHREIQGWAHEMFAWFALTQGRFSNAIDSARIGQAVAANTSVHVQLIAQEAKAVARLGGDGTRQLLESGGEFLSKLPYPDRPDNHFKVDPAKWDYYAMDVARVSGDNDNVKRYADVVITEGINPEGLELAPMRIAESRLSLGLVALREGDLEAGVSYAMESVAGERQSLPHIRMVAREFALELEARFANERLAADTIEAFKSLA